MDATCAIQASIHVFSLVRKYVSRILGTYQLQLRGFRVLCVQLSKSCFPVQKKPPFSEVPASNTANV